MRVVALLVTALLLLAPRALAIPDCSELARYRTAEAHYKSGCLLTAMRICANLWPIGPNNRYDCYEYNLTQCELDGTLYRKWLEHK